MAEYEKLSYCPDTGAITWKVRAGRARAGDEAGCVWTNKTNTYKQIRIEGKLRLAHRIAWEMYYGEEPRGQIDHVNGDGLDNRIDNLRLVDNQANSKNSRLYSTSSTGVTGVTKHLGDKYRASICLDGVTTHIGIFKDKFEAICARKAADNIYGFHENHGRGYAV